MFWKRGLFPAVSQAKRVLWRVDRRRPRPLLGFEATLTGLRCRGVADLAHLYGKLRISIITTQKMNIEYGFY